MFICFMITEWLKVPVLRSLHSFINCIYILKMNPTLAGCLHSGSSSSHAADRVMQLYKVKAQQTLVHWLDYSVRTLQRPSVLNIPILIT